MKKIISILITVILLASVFTFSVSAANNSILSFSSNTITIGDKVTVTLTIKSDKPIYAYEYKLNYDANKLNYPNAAGVIHEINFASGEKSLSFKYTFTSTAVGTASIKTSECTVSDGQDEIPLSNTGANLAIKDVALSNNANLKSLSLSSGKLSPKFSANRTNYTASVAFETKSIRVYANTSDSKAKVDVANPIALNIGNNTIKVNVTAPSGSQKVYTISVTRLKEGEKLPNETEEPSIETPVEPNKLETNIAGTTYTIATEIPEDKILNGFKLDKITYNDTEVPVVVDDGGRYTLYYLKSADSEELVPYYYDSKLETFERLKHLVFGENVYIFEKIPAEYKTPESLYKSNVKIGDFSVECLSSNDDALADMHYIYCYSNGNYAVYRYDALENTIQRYPELLLEKIEDTLEKNNFLTRFNSLSANSKIIIVLLAIAVLGALALIVILAIFVVKKLSSGKNDIELDVFSEDDFEEIKEIEQIEIKDQE